MKSSTATPVSTTAPSPHPDACPPQNPVRQISRRSRVALASDGTPTVAGDGLAAWLTHPAADAWFGKSFPSKFTILAHVVSGHGTQADVARQLGVSKQYVSRQCARARTVFGLRHPCS